MINGAYLSHAPLMSEGSLLSFLPSADENHANAFTMWPRSLPPYYSQCEPLSDKAKTHRLARSHFHHRNDFICGFMEPDKPQRGAERWHALLGCFIVTSARKNYLQNMETIK